MVTRRRTPQQGRSRALVDAMLEAVSRLVAEGGFRLTTNNVADVAGVSVGSVYQYFSSKEGLLRAWVERVIHVRTEKTRRCLAEQIQAETTLAYAVGQLIDVALETRQCASHESGLFVAFFRFGVIDAIKAADAELLPLLRDLLKARSHQTRPLDPELGAFVLLHALRSVIIAAAQSEATLRDPRLRAELLHLSMAYLLPLSADGGAPPRSEFLERTPAT
jgi:AcrR family transcriptional regulator